jgi:hypothetical protein
MAVPAVPVALMIAGGYLTWFGVHYWRTDVAWPSDPVKAVLTGKPLPVGTKSSASELTTSILGPGMSIYNDVTGARAAAGGPAAAGVPGPGTLDRAGLESLWSANGGNPTVAGTAAAVALAESSGRTDATSTNPDGGTNVGLWQLDTRGVGSGYSIDQLKDPATNARVTVLGSLNGANWSAWQTFVEGTYRRFL